MQIPPFILMIERWLVQAGPSVCNLMVIYNQFSLQRSLRATFTLPGCAASISVCATEATSCHQGPALACTVYRSTNRSVQIKLLCSLSDFPLLATTALLLYSIFNSPCEGKTPVKYTPSNLLDRSGSVIFYQILCSRCSCSSVFVISYFQRFLFYLIIPISNSMYFSLSQLSIWNFKNCIDTVVGDFL